MTEDISDRRSIGDFSPTFDAEDNIIDFATGKILKKHGPEEIIRQWYENVLVNSYGYNKEQIDIEVLIKMGTKNHYADIGIYETNDKSRLKIIVETKEPNRKDGIDQLQSYLEAKGVQLGVWTNGNDIDYFYHPEAQEFQPILDIPEKDETLESMEYRIKASDLYSSTDLISVFEWCEDQIIAHQGGLDVFNETFKIIFTKLYDEIENLHSSDSVSLFYAGPTEDPSLVAERIKRLFEGSDEHNILGTKRKWSDVFRRDEEIELNDVNITRVVGRMQRISLMKTDVDVLGTGFEALVPDQMKSEKGQYFTPRQVVKLATQLTNPRRSEKILDPACGSGGFLIYVLKYLLDKLLSEWGEENESRVMELLREYASNNTFGLDYDQRLVRVAKAYMIVWGDGRANIRHVPDSLTYFTWPGDISAIIPENHFDIVLTNPPFSGELDLRNIWQHYDLSYKNGNQLDKQRKDIVFLERCIKHIKPGGKLCIVLPKGTLDEKEKKYVRDYIKEKTYIRAIIGLHRFTFLPYAGDTTSLLLLEKKDVDEIEDYEIFMAVSTKPGKNKEGELIYLRGEDGKLILDDKGLPILNTDLFEIGHEFNRRKGLNIGYIVHYSQLEDRINSEYYHPKYKTINDQLDTSEVVLTIDELLSDDSTRPLINGLDISGLFPSRKREYVEVGTPYLRAGDVRRNDIDIRGCEKVNMTTQDINENRKLVVGDVLISRKGTTGRASVVTEREVNSIISSEVMKLILKKKITIEEDDRNIDPFYITAYLNSLNGRMQIEQHLTGSLSLGINQTDLKTVRIPIPTEEIQAQISEPYRTVRQLMVEIERLNIESLRRCNEL